MTIKYPKRPLIERFWLFFDIAIPLPAHKDLRLFLLFLEDISNFTINYEVVQGHLRYPITITDSDNVRLVTYTPFDNKGGGEYPIDALQRKLVETINDLEFFSQSYLSILKKKEGLNAIAFMKKYNIISIGGAKHALSKAKWLLNKLQEYRNPETVKSIPKLEESAPEEMVDIVENDLTKIINSPDYSNDKKAKAQALLHEYLLSKERQEREKIEKITDEQAEIVFENIRKNYLDK
ncbi:hypothetical protein [Rossellomorea marisflavi]|uniref:hypothetical protein n=1 Tax=Rossellomorea marisflavi TaxID=189381 RepID=UPI003FA09601